MSLRCWRSAIAVGVVVAGVACDGDRAGSKDAAKSERSDTAGVAAVIDRLTSDSARASAAADSTAAAAARGSSRAVRIGDADLTGIGHDAGKTTAPVVVVMFSDFGCADCRRFAVETFPKLEREYVRTGKVFFKYVPVISGAVPNTQQATRAAECAADQGKFWAMYDSLYAHQANWKAATVPSRVFAPYLGADVDRATYGGCYTRQALHPRTARANQIVAQLDVSQIPTFVVNERVIAGALSFAALRQAIDEELKKGTPTKG